MNQNIIYTIRKNKRSKHIRITVKPGGVVTVSAPKTVSEARVHAFVREKDSWIRRTVHKLSRVQHPILNIRSAAHYKQYKEAARELLTEKVAQWNRFYNLSFKRISIKNHASRWGSCSRAGNLNFNYKLQFLPEHLQDYVVVHELCHLAELNHGRKFWSLVSKTIPDWHERRRELHRLR